MRIFDTLPSLAKRTNQNYALVGATIGRPPKKEVFRIFRREIAVFSPCGDRFCKQNLRASIARPYEITSAGLTS